MVSRAVTSLTVPVKNQHDSCSLKIAPLDPWSSSAQASSASGGYGCSPPGSLPACVRLPECRKLSFERLQLRFVGLRTAAQFQHEPQLLNSKQIQNVTSKHR